MRHSLLLLICVLATVASSSHELRRRATKKSQGTYKIVCYYGNWAVYRRGLARFTPQNINPFLCTHVIYAFGGFSNNFEMKPFDRYNDIDQGNYKKFIELKKYNSRLKTMLAVGGWNEGSSRFSTMVESPENREKFIHSAIRFLRTNGFDGLDLDWEYPTFRDGSDLADREGYASLIKELREAFNNEKLSSNKQRLLLSIAVPAGQEYISQGYDIPTIVENVDFMNLLTYDYHTAYEPAANHQAPLLRRPDLDEDDYRVNLNIDSTVKYYLEIGAPPQKLILGIPTYGRGYTLEDEDSHELGAAATAPGEAGPFTKESGYMAYYEICQKIRDEGWEVYKPYPNEVGPYAVKGDQWIGFDDVDMVKRKAKYIRDNKLGGAMFWSLDNDDFRAQCGDQPNPLITSVRKVLLGKGSKDSSNSIFWKSGKETGSPALAASSNSDTTETKFSRHKTETSRRSTPISTRRPFKITPRPLRSRTTTPEDLDDEDIDDDELLDTPPPPPTPDPGPAFECKDSGFFPNPVDCKKYFWCLDSGPANLGIVPHAFTCPSGLYFNKRTDACDYPERVKCKITAKQSTTTTTTTTTTKASTLPRRRTTVTTTTTTTTTTPAPTTLISSSKGDDLAELLRLIQQLGGVDGVQKYLQKKDGKEMTSLASQLKGSKHHTTVPSDEEIATTKRTRLLSTHTPRSRGHFFNGEDEARSRAAITDSSNSATDRQTRTYVTIIRTTTETSNEGNGDNDKNDDEVTSPTSTTTEPPSTLSTRTLFRSTAIRLRTPTPRPNSTPTLKVRTNVSPLRTRRLSTTTEIIPSTLTIPTTVSITTTKPTTTEEPPTQPIHTTKRKRIRTTTAKMKQHKDLDEEIDEEEEIITTTSASSSLGSSEETKAEEKKGGKWKPTRRVTRKRRPVAVKKIEEPIDIETTDSRLSTTVQKAPSNEASLISKSKADSVDAHEEEQEEEDDDFDTDGNEPIGDSASSGATNTFVFTTPQPIGLTSTTENVLDNIPGEGRTIPAENTLPNNSGPVFNTQFTAGLGRPSKFRPLFSTQSLLAIRDDTNTTELPTRIFFPPSRPPNPLRPLPAILRSVTARSTTTTLALKPDDEEDEDEEEEEEEEEKLTKPPKVTSRPRQTKPRKSESNTNRRPTPFPKVVPVTLKPQPTLEPTEDITRAFDPDDDSEIGIDEKGRLECAREGIFEHPISCSKFVNCVNTMGDLRPWTYTCPPGLLYDIVVGHCNWQEQVDCGKRK